MQFTIIALYSLTSWLAWLTATQGSALKAGVHRRHLRHHQRHQAAGVLDHSHGQNLRYRAAGPSNLINEPEAEQETTTVISLPGHPNVTTTATDQATIITFSSSSPTPQDPLKSSHSTDLTGSPNTELKMTANLSSAIASLGLSDDLFTDPIDTKPPPSQMQVQKDHPVPRKGIMSKPPLQTNKFFANFFLGDQRGPTYTFPYSIAWTGGNGPTASWGMACSHINASQRVYGQTKFNGASSYYLNPVGIQSMILSAKELGPNTTLTMDSITAFSSRVHLNPAMAAPPAVSFPLVQGMAYVTGEYSSSTPQIQSGVFFKTVTRVTKDPKSNVAKFTFILEDGTTWRVYAWRTKGDQLDLKVVNNSLAEAKKPFYGIIQITKDPMTSSSEQELDDGSGIYPVTLELSGSAKGKTGQYSFQFQKEGHQTGDLYMYALPHHLSSFDPSTQKQIQQTQLQSTTKGLATMVKGSKWTMIEPSMPSAMGFAPWHPEKGNCKTISDHAKSIIRSAAEKEVSQNMMAQCNLDSMYFSGKVSVIENMQLVRKLT